MDVNVNAEAKAYGTTVAPTSVEVEDRAKPQVQPVKQGDNSSKTELDEKRLHGRDGEAQGARKNVPSKEELDAYVKEIQENLDSIGANLSLGLGTDKKTESIVAQIVERDTGKLIRQVPSEEVLQLRAKLEELSGILFDKQA